MEPAICSGTVLVVEDDRLVAEVLSAIVEEFTNRHAVICDDGANALEKVREIKPDAVLLDIVLPGQDGLTIYDRLKSQSDTAGIPVIFLTCQDRYRQEVRSRRAKWYLGKPFELDDLLTALNQAFSTTQESALAS